ncbi:MAG: hypothetical protein AAB648_00765 [Patescibacteria group bacterium]
MQNFPPKLSQNAIIAEKFIINSGVIVIDPDSTWISPDINIGHGTIIYPNSYLIGDNRSFIGENCEIGPNAFLRDSFGIGNRVKIGFNAEVVRSFIGSETKIPHFCHIGDATIGQCCNIAAGTVFCNYNGNKKQIIVIGNYVFIGSGANLIAPVTIADYAYIAAGAIVSKDVKRYSVVIGVNKVLKGKKSYYQPLDGWRIYPINEHPTCK